MRRLVLVHGFTQTRRCWAPVDNELATDHEVVAVDAPGHGAAADVRAGIDDGAVLIGESGGRAVYVGYSMGGRYCLRLALDRPDLVAGLVLIGASPGLADPVARAERRRADEVLADHVESVGVAAFLDEWLAQPLFAGLPAERRCLDERRTNTAAGLASSLRRAGTGAQSPLWDRLGELGERALPVLLVTGADDAKFTAVAGEMAARIGALARQIVLPGAGHTAHLENPAAFTAALRSWEADQATAETSSPTASSTPKINWTRPV